MRSGFLLLLLLCMIPITTNAQDDKYPLLNIGDHAPPLQVREWIKGEPVRKFEKGYVYVVELWATWCKHFTQTTGSDLRVIRSIEAITGW